jgi:hypothetical protein
VTIRNRSRRSAMIESVNQGSRAGVGRVNVFRDLSRSCPISFQPSAVIRS